MSKKHIFDIRKILTILRQTITFHRCFLFFRDEFSHFILLTQFFLYFYRLMNIQHRKYIASILFVLISFVCVAQGGNPPPPLPPPPPGLPIDGLTPFILILALFYGVRKHLNGQQ